MVQLYPATNNKLYRGKQVLLAPVRHEDLPTLWQWINNRELVLFNAPYKPVSEPQHLAWYEHQVQNNPALALFAIRECEGNQLVGTCQLHSIHPVHRHAELQIRIGETHCRGKGYGSEAVQLLLQFAFNDLNLNRVYLSVFSTNEPAIHVYEKAGFVREGLMRQAAYIDGEYVDVVTMGILAHEYNPSTSR